MSEGDSDYYIEAMKLLEARAEEIAYFSRYLRAKPRLGTRLPSQNLPKHMRRRAMSHNRYRVPSRVRGRLAPTNARPKRRIARGAVPRAGFRRRLFRAATDLSLLWSVNAGQRALLETHRFLAKRCVMTERAGVRVAARAKAKQHRTVWRFLHTNRLVEDKSHFCFCRVSAETFAEFQSLPFSTEWTALPCADGDFLLLTDALLLPALSENARALQWEVGAGALTLFEVLGPKAVQSFERILELCSNVNESFAKAVESGVQSSQFPNGSLFPLYIQFPDKAMISPPFEKMENRPLSDVQTAIRSLWTRKSVSFCPQTILNALEALVNCRRNGTAPPESAPTDSVPAIVFLSVVKGINGASDLPRFFLLAPAGHGNKLLKALLSGSAKLIGCDEKTELLQQLGYEPFPATCLPFASAFHDNRLREAQQKHERRGPRQRCDYLALGVMFPFGVDLSYFKGRFALCRFAVPSVGRVRNGAAVFAATEAERRAVAKPQKHKNLYQRLMQSEPPIEFAADFVVRGAASEPFACAAALAQRLQSECAYKRSVIGQVLTAFFAFKSMRVAGWLFARAEAVADSTAVTLLANDHNHLIPVSIQLFRHFEL